MAAEMTTVMATVSGRCPWWPAAELLLHSQNLLFRLQPCAAWLDVVTPPLELPSSSARLSLALVWLLRRGCVLLFIFLFLWFFFFAF